ncbi:MAG TPA: YciI family protein [Thermoleophilaceae bacterium]|nr:YciI family protein [Thermoleophilaceae bacterium]
MDFLIYSRAAPNAADIEDEDALNEAHWSYMDRFADGMVARGPTLGPDRETWTGSIHIVNLPSADAAHEFVEQEPYNRAGLFEEHFIRRFRNLLGRTMWGVPGSD